MSQSPVLWRGWAVRTLKQMWAGAGLAFRVGRARSAVSRDRDGTPGSAHAETVIPLVTEKAAIAKQIIETARFQVARVTHEREQLIDELLAYQTAEIERVRIGRLVDTTPVVREEGDTVVIPIVDEVLVVERRLFLKEEVRLHRVRSTTRHQESVTLRHHEAVVTHLSSENASSR